MDNVLLFPLVLLAIYIFISVVILTISAVKNRHEYRIKKVTVGTKDEYYIQKHFLFFWYTCQVETYPGDYEEVCFDTLEEAKKYIEKQKEKIDKKIEYFYY